jgi:hypothetical protein
MLALQNPMRAVAKSSARKIAPCVLAATLLAAVAAQVSFAENAAPRPDAAKHANPPAQSTGTSPSAATGPGLEEKFENHPSVEYPGPHDNAAGPKSQGAPATGQGASTAGRQNQKTGAGGAAHGRAGDAPAAKQSLPIGKADISSEAHGGDAGTFDTRIPLPARRFGASPGNLRPGTSRFRIGTSASTHPQRFSVPARAIPLTRNAIGMSVVPTGQIPLRGGESRGAPPQVSVREPARIAAINAGSPAKTGIGPSTSAHSIANSAVGGPAAPSGTKTGTGLFRPGSTAVGLGGSAKVVAGINGTGIRPKH